MDWDAWLGPCPWRPYNHSYVRGGWRGVYDFHTSCIGEWGAHTFAQAQAGIGCGDTSPGGLRIRRQPERRRHGLPLRQRREDDPVPRRQVLARLVRRALRRLRRLGRRRRRILPPGGLQPGDAGEFNKVVGDYVARTGRALNHMRNFLDCVKSRQQTVANPRVMHHSMTTVHAANICMWLKRDLATTR